MWFVFALLSAVFAGLQAFLMKVAAERKYDTYHASAASALVAFLAAGVLFLSTSSSLDAIPSIVYWLGLASGILYIGRTITQFEALRFIDAAIFFPLYKVAGPAFVTVLGVLLLKDQVAPWEMVGIVLSCLVPLLLVSKQEHHRQKNLNLGLVLMFVSTAFAAFTAAVNAAAVQPSESFVIPFMVIAYAFSAIISVALYVRRHKARELAAAIRAHSAFAPLLMSVGIGLFQIGSFFFLLLAFAGSNLSLAYTINAHYIVIPVVLSVLFYKEHWNLQKAVALAISVLALALLHR